MVELGCLAETGVRINTTQLSDVAGNLGAYQALRDFHTVLVSGVPQMDPTLDNAARRFIALVDEFYDRGVKLVLAAHAPIDELYVGDRLRFEFDRTRSRLAEMQTHEYLSRPHRP